MPCPPRETRAYFRGHVTEKFGDAVVAASWQNVTLRAKDSYALFHLDEVDGLGDFVELEAVLGEPATPEAGAAQVARWRDLLGLTEQVPDSYIDLRYGR